jgi:hypothetical protein
VAAFLTHLLKPHSLRGRYHCGSREAW